MERRAGEPGRWWVGLLVVAVGSLAALLAAVTRLRLQGDAERLELLVELGDGAPGASVEQTAARLGGLLVPAVADACLVELSGEDGARRVACTVGADAAALAEASPPDEPALCDPMPPGAPAALRSVPGASPLQARARTIGTLRMGVGPSGRRFGPRDLRFAAVLADRVALALENAGLGASSRTPSAVSGRSSTG